jgi:hypothetical protein
VARRPRVGSGWSSRAETIGGGVRLKSIAVGRRRARGRRGSLAPAGPKQCRGWHARTLPCAGVRFPTGHLRARRPTRVRPALRVVRRRCGPVGMNRAASASASASAGAITAVCTVTRTPVARISAVPAVEPNAMWHELRGLGHLPVDNPVRRSAMWCHIAERRVHCAGTVPTSTIGLHIPPPALDSPLT